MHILGTVIKLTKSPKTAEINDKEIAECSYPSAEVMT